MNASEYWQQQYDLFSNGFRGAMASGNTTLAAFNVGQALVAAEMGFMIGWKDEGRTDAFTTMMSYPKASLALGPANELLTRFTPFPALLLSLAYTGDVDRDVLSAWVGGSEKAGSDRRFDAALAGALVGGDAPEVNVPSKSKLWKESMATYVHLLRLAQDRDEGAFLAVVEDALKLYGRRRRDSYFSGGAAVEGGGEYNPAIFDFRLAAIIRCSGMDMSAVPAELAFLATHE